MQCDALLCTQVSWQQGKGISVATGSLATNADRKVQSHDRQIGHQLIAHWQGQVFLSFIVQYTHVHKTHLFLPRGVDGVIFD